MDSTLWEALKVVIRGFVISYEATQKKPKETYSRLSEIDQHFALLRKQYREVPPPLALREIVNLKHEYNIILSQQISTLLLKVRQKQFELGEKHGPLLS